jgi:asparagine synthase (glutamine-hydrolysing)
MCGIAGFLDLRSERTRSLQILAAMTRAIAHRGPNAEGLWQSPEGVVNLGHRRLSIIDLSPTGAQPMVSRDERYVLIFNGEIYNFQELRQNLQSEGNSFLGTSDTEVLLVALIRWGIRTTLGRLNGMFAFALWDEHERTLSLARDRFGEKPLYFGWQDGVFLFGSELKALAKHPSLRREIEPEALSLFLRFNYVPTPWSIFRGIYKLTPGHFLRVMPGGGKVESEAYWSLRDSSSTRLRRLVDAKDEDFLNELDTRLKKAVKMRMVADVPLGAFLSGGIDSSLIVALMQAQSSRPVKTFTIGFGETSHNEALDAAIVARHLGTEHHEYYLSSRECVDMVGRIADLYDEPFADSSQIPTALISEFTKRHVTVALTGDAGDEMWGGYNRYLWSSRLWPQLERIPPPVRKGLAAIIRRRSPSEWDRWIAWGNQFVPSRLRVRGGGGKIHKLALGLAARNSDELYHCLVSQWQDPGVVLRESREPAFLDLHLAGAPANLSFVERMMYVDILTYLTGDILCKVDRASMAVGLETRVPYLDNDAVELALSIPAEIRMRHGIGKWPLRQVLKRYLPEVAFDRPKLGFGIPIGTWMRGPMKPWIEDMLSESRLRADGVFKTEVVRRELEQHLSGRLNNEHTLWGIVMFQAWLRRTW